MDPSNSNGNFNLTPELAQGLQNLTDKDKQDLNQFIQAETQKAQIQGTIHQLTDVCFRKCITSKISAAKLDRSEEPCMQNCVDRFMDSNMSIIRHLEQMRPQ